MENKQQFTLWYFLGVIVLLFAVQTFFGRAHVGTLSYSDFKTLLQAGKVHDVTLGSETIQGTVDLDGAEKLLPPAVLETMKTTDSVPPQGAQEKGAGAVPVKATHPFIARRVEDPQLTAQLDAAKVRYTAATENRWLSTLLSWVLPMVIFIAAWNFMLRRSGAGHMGSMMELGQSKAKVYVQSQTGVRFADVAGIDEAKEELMEVVEFLRNPDRYRRLGGKIPKGVLIVGAPGTGKTLLAKAVAGEAGVAFLSISGSEFVEMFVGVGAARVRDLFAQAEKKAPCIIFIDELDALGKARGFSTLGGNEEREQTLNQLLVQMDGFDTKNGVIIMAATNRPEILDPALLRPGRFDRHVAIDRPDIKGREQILQVHARNVKLAPDVDLRVVAAKTAGFAGADLANIVNEAALRAARKDKPLVEMRDFDEAIDRVVGGLEKRNRVMSSTEKETVAYHEAGHALVAESRRYADRVSKISIIPRGIGALGFTQQVPTEDRYLLKRSELLDRLDVLLGGRVAEELVYGDVSTGAQNDLQRATDMARHMITQYGMSERLGHVTFDTPRQSALPGVPEVPRQATYSEQTAQLIDQEIGKLIEEAHARVARTLTEKRATLETLARLLLKQEVVERAMLDEVLKGAGTAPTAGPSPAQLPMAAASATVTLSGATAGRSSRDCLRG
jgi:cell division protease FtsH